MLILGMKGLKTGVSVSLHRVKTIYLTVRLCWELVSTPT